MAVWMVSSKAACLVDETGLMMVVWSVVLLVDLKVLWMDEHLVDAMVVGKDMTMVDRMVEW